MLKTFALVTYIVLSLTFAFAQEPFYQCKTVTVVSSTAAATTILI